MKNNRLARLLATLTMTALIFTGFPLMTGDTDAYAASTKKPVAVKTLKVSLTKANKAKLKWTCTGKRVKGYAIYRNGKLLVRVGKSKKSYIDKTVKAGKTYKYYVKAYNTYKVKRWYNKKTGKYQKKKPAKKYRGKWKKVKLYRYGKKSPTRKIRIKKAGSGSSSGSDSKKDSDQGDSGPNYVDITKDVTYETGADGGIVLTAYNGSAANIKIPAEINGKKVTAIADECFRGNFRLINVIIPDGVTSIGDYAFESCTFMKNVTFPAHLKTIGKGAFSGCCALCKEKNIVIPDSVESIDDGAFLYCMGAGGIVLPKNLKSMGQFAFAGCEEVKEISFSCTSLETIPDRAFCNCHMLNKAILPEGVKKIGKRAFSDCGITEVYFPASLEEVGDYAFEKCIYLVRSFGDEDGTVVFNSNNLKLGHKAFYAGPKNPGVHMWMPGSTVIEDDTFALSPVRAVTLYGEGGDLTAADDGSLYKEDALIVASWDCGDELTVNSETKKLGAYVFSGVGCGKIIIPDTLQEIDEKAFYEANVKSIEVAQSDPGTGSPDAAAPVYMASANGDALFERDSTDPDQPVALIRFFRGNKEVTSYDLPDPVKRIAPYAFYGAGKITVNISENSQLTEVCHNAFTGSGIANADTGSGGDSIESYGSVSFAAISDQVTIDPDAFKDYFGYNEFDFDFDFNNLDLDSLLGDPPAEQGDPTADTGDSDKDTEQVPEYIMESLAGSQSLFDEDKYASFADVDTKYGFLNWTKAYVQYNKDSGRIDFSKYGIEECMPYTSLYKGESHYRAMAAVLNHDEYKHNWSIMNVGDDYENMYLMMDHGLFTELGFAQVQEDLILYSGITPQRKAEIAGLDDVSQTATTDELLARIDENYEYVDTAMMSTTTEIATAFNFSAQSETMVIIYASKEKLDELGSICIDATASQFSEEEILLGHNARYKVLDVGTIREKDGDKSRTYIKLELLGKKTD